MNIKEFVKYMFFPNQEIIDKFEDIEFQELNPKKVELNCFESDDLTLIKIDSGALYNEKQSDFYKLYSDIFKVIEYPLNIDLKQIDSVEASKSKAWGYKFDTMFDFGLHNNISYTKSLSGVWSEAMNRDFTIRKFKWNNRMVWSNSGTSHRMASLIYHLTCSNQTFMVKANVKEYSINEAAFEKFFSSYDMFLINKKSIDEVYTILRTFLDLEEVRHFQSVSLENRVLVIKKTKKELYKTIIKKLEYFNQDYIINIKKYIAKRIR